MTALQTEVLKQIRRINRFLREASKRGFEFPEEMKQTFDKKKVSGRLLERLKKKTPQEMYKKAKYASELSDGEIVSGQEGRRLERSEASRKAAETRRQKRQAPTITIIDQIEGALQDIPDGKYIKRQYHDFSTNRNKLLEILYDRVNEAESEDELTALCNYYESVQERIFECIEIIRVDSDGDNIKVQFAELARLLKGTALTITEAEEIEEMYGDYEGW